MTYAEILVLSVGLAMDATAVAAARWLATPKILPKHVALVALFFGGSQALMPLIGWAVGAGLGPVVEAWDHWLAFILLGGLGAKMLWEARGEPDEVKDRDPFALKIMFTLAIATSVDAAVAGITLPMVDAPLLLTLITIGVTTAVLSALGLFAGQRFGALLGKRLDVLGGVALIGLGLKTLVEHLTA